MNNQSWFMLIPYTDMNGHARQILVCDHYYIAAVWQTGYYNIDRECGDRLHMITYPGERIDFDSANGDVLEQAEKWIRDWNEKMGYDPYPPIRKINNELSLP